VLGPVRLEVREGREEEVGRQIEEQSCEKGRIRRVVVEIGKLRELDLPRTTMQARQT
jgi:hypothetical protein